MQEERYGARDLTYSAWHRRLSLRRFVGIEKAQTLAMVDIDASLFVEFDESTREPLALIETAKDVGQAYKTATVTARLAQRAGLPAYTLLYKAAAEVNPAAQSIADVAGFRLRRVWPAPEPEWRTLTPQEWAHALVKIRDWACAKLDVEAVNDPVYEPIGVQGLLFGGDE